MSGVVYEMLFSSAVTRLLSSGSLVVMAPTVEDTATYECLASNEAGEDSHTVNLTVQGQTTRLRSQSSRSYQTASHDPRV